MKLLTGLPFVLLFLFGLVEAGLPRTLQAEAPAKVATLLQPFVEKQELAGAVALVLNKEKVLAVETVGYADIEAKRPMAPNSLFWIASQSKPITATAVMLLVDEGKIALDDPVEKYLPEFRGQVLRAEPAVKKPGRPITIRDTLSHMSGLPFKSPAEAPTLDGLNLADAVRSYAATPLETEPGTKYQYSNAGINTAARIIEVVTKMKYEDFMQERLFGPLGMQDTTFWPNEEQTARLAQSYKPNGDKVNPGLAAFNIGQLTYPLSNHANRYPMPAGGLFSTANDVAQYCRMMLNGGELNGRRYVSESSFRELTKRQTPDTVKESYGLGFSVGPASSSGVPEWFGHGGAHSTNMEIRPAKNIAIVWMVQHAGFPGEGAKAKDVFKNWALEKFGK